LPATLTATLASLVALVELLNFGNRESGGRLACLERLGFTHPCAQIWAFNVRHTQDKCLGPCISPGFCHLPDGTLNDCLTCDERESGPVFKAVASRTRRNTELATSICRTCTEARASLAWCTGSRSSGGSVAASPSIIGSSGGFGRDSKASVASPLLNAWVSKGKRLAMKRLASTVALVALSCGPELATVQSPDIDVTDDAAAAISSLQWVSTEVGSAYVDGRLVVGRSRTISARAHQLVAVRFRAARRDVIEAWVRGGPYDRTKLWVYSRSQVLVGKTTNRAPDNSNDAYLRTALGGTNVSKEDFYLVMMPERDTTLSVRILGAVSHATASTPQPGSPETQALGETAIRAPGSCTATYLCPIRTPRGEVRSFEFPASLTATVTGSAPDGYVMSRVRVESQGVANDAFNWASAQPWSVTVDHSTPVDHRFSTANEWGDAIWSRANETPTGLAVTLKLSAGVRTALVNCGNRFVDAPTGVACSFTAAWQP
jgi:hypothetical protein